MTINHDLLNAQQNPLEVEKRLPYWFTTGKGSVYRLNEDSHYERFKTAAGEAYPPADITVFMDVNDAHTENHLLRAAQDTGNIFIVEFRDNVPEQLSTMSDYKGGEMAVVVANSYTTKADSRIAVRASIYPFEGAQVYEERAEPGLIYRHVGSKVSAIGY